MKNTIITIDSYLSDEDRADACRNLIKQIREVFCDEYEILLINKSNNDWGLQKEVEYYYNLSNSFLVGYPPEHILISERYERPYVYVWTDFGVCENWLPLTGVTDHVAGIYNSFVLSSKISQVMGYSHVFKVEYDTVFDIDELKDIKSDIEKEKDFIFYGKRKMGEYAKDHHYLIDVHIVAYSNKLFDGFSVVKNDEEFWELNKKINYYGKWIEYIIPSIFEYQKINNEYDGIIYDGFIFEKYPLSKFDVINGKGVWVEKWKDIPKICYIKNDNDEDFNVGLFYWNEDHEKLEVNIEIKNDHDETVYSKSINLGMNNYVFDKLKINDEKFYIEKINKFGDQVETYTQMIDKQMVLESNIHFKLNN